MSPNHYLEESENDNKSLNNVFYNNDIDNSELFGDIEPLKVSLKVENTTVSVRNLYKIADLCNIKERFR